MFAFAQFFLKKVPPSQFLGLTNYDTDRHGVSSQVDIQDVVLRPAPSTYTETCWKCELSGLTQHVQNTNLHMDSSWWFVSTIPFKKSCFGKTCFISLVGWSRTFCTTLLTHLSLPLDSGLLESKESSLLPLYFQTLLLSLARETAQQMFVYLNWADLQVSLELKSWIPGAVSFCTDWLHFHF